MAGKSGEAEAKFKILMIGQAPGERAFKSAAALRARGLQVTLAFARPEEGGGDFIRLSGPLHLWDLSAGYDLVHCHNAPDTLAVAALAGEAPVVHDTAELRALRYPGNANRAFLEGAANRAAAGRVYANPGQLAVAEEQYHPAGPSVVVYDYPGPDETPGQRLAKLSADDHKAHLVYCGGLEPDSHLDLAGFFRHLAGRGVVVHIHPEAFDPATARALAHADGVVYEGPLPTDQLAEALTRYDAGVLPLNLAKGHKDFLDTTLSPSLFKYLAAGLPVAASPARAYVEFFREHPVGRLFSDAEGLIRSLPELRRLAEAQDLSEHAPAFASQAALLEGLYQEVLAGSKRESRDPAPAARREAPTRPAITLDEPEAAEPPGAKTMFFVNTQVDLAKLAVLLDRQDGPFTVTSVDKDLMAQIAGSGLACLGPEDVGQNYYLERMAWGAVYPERTKHYHVFQEAFKPMIELEGVRRFSGLDLYQGGEFNQANNVGYWLFKLVDILHDLLEEYRPAKVVCLEKGGRELSLPCQMLGDLSAKFGYELTALTEQ